MPATLLPGGWYVEPDVIDERTGLPMLTSTQIDGINQRIASGFNQYAIGTRVLRTDDGAVLTLTGIGATAAFVPAGAGDVPPASFEGLLGDPTDNVPLAVSLGRLLPANGALGQVVARTASGYGWIDPPAASSADGLLALLLSASTYARTETFLLQNGS